MAKIEVLDVIEIDGEMFTVDKATKKRFEHLYPAMVGMMTLTTPSMVFASGDDTFRRIWDSAMIGLEYGAAMIIVFAGVAWMLGHRSKGIELLISVACGFIVARHALDIVAFLKTI